MKASIHEKEYQRLVAIFGADSDRTKACCHGFRQCYENKERYTNDLELYLLLSAKFQTETDGRHPVIERVQCWM